MLRSLKTKLSRNFINSLGWKTKRKIIVIESDDWGMIRMNSIKAQEYFKIKGYKISQCPYNLNDRIENNEDIELLGETLLSVKDINGNPAKFTINNIVANPDYDKIKADGYKNYYYQTSSESLDQYKDSRNVMSLFREGVKKDIFQPQLHGREHINLRLWLERLQEGHPKAVDTFNQQMYTVHHSGSINGRKDNLDAFGNSTLHGENYNYAKIIKEAQRLFRDNWGFRSSSFIAPCYVWHPSLEEILCNEGIKYIQGTHVQRIPLDNNSIKIKRKYHYTGQRNKHGQCYLIRNCFFEPTESGINNVVENVLKDIHLSFIYKKPAIISSHRVNYIGSLNPENRIQNLKLLNQLLNQILKFWPDVEFMSSDQLGDLITTNKCVE